MNIIFAGTPDFARVALAALLQAGHTICCVYTQPDRPAGRGMALKASPVKTLALEWGVPVEQPISLRKPESLEKLRQYPCDLMIVAAYGLILPQAVLDHPRLGCVNIHASLLPRWRGAAPIVRAIQSGDTATGISIMQMEAGLDTGPYFARVETPILASDTGQTLHDKLADLGAQAMLDCLPKIVNASLQPTIQPEQGVTYAHKILKAEAQLDWRIGAAALVNQIRAFDPFPGCLTTLKGQPLKVWSARLTDFAPSNAVAGNVAQVNLDSFVVICDAPVAEDGQSSEQSTYNALEITSAQLPGGKRLSGRAMMQALALSTDLVLGRPPE